MKFPIVVEKKKDRHGDKVFDAFCPLFHDARTFSLCDDKNDAIDEVQEIVQDEVDELVDSKQPLPKLPKADELKKKYPDAKVYWVKVETDAEDDDDYDEDEEPEEDEPEDEEQEDDESLDDDDEEAEDEYDEVMDDLLDDDDE